MKFIKYLFAVAAFSVAFSSCKIEGENIFPTKPIAPELAAHSDILMTENTMAEDVNFSWSKARYIGELVSYELCAYYGKDSIILEASTDLLYYVSSKVDFKTKVYEGFPALPTNDIFSMKFKVNATSEVGKFSSTAIDVNIYAFGGAISPEVTPVSEEVVLDKADPMGEVKLISWTPARLVYGEAVHYNVFLKVGDGDELEYAKEIRELEFNTTIDKLNEAVIVAGGAEDAKVNVQIIVKAYSKTVTDGVPAAAVTIPITTYIATFPDFMYVPGSHQGYDPASAPKMPQSTKVKGLYEGIVDLTKGTETVIKFKFSPNPSWTDDFSIDNIVITKFAGTYSAVTGSGAAKSFPDIEVPAGLYNIVLNKKLNTLKMFQIETLGIIGDAVKGTGWDKDSNMVYDAAAKTFTVTVGLLKGKGIKFRPNDNFDYSLGGSQNNVSATEGGNIAYEGEDGNYKVVLNVATNPYTIKYINTSYPDNLYVPGAHQEYSPTTAPKLAGNGEGLYEGFSDLGEKFKLLPTNVNWDGAFGGTFEELTLGGGDILVAAADVGHYFLKVDLTTMKIDSSIVNKVSLCGDPNSWGDTQMTYDDTSKKWTATGFNVPVKADATKSKVKFRINNGWDHNYGGDLTNLTQGGADMLFDAGVYTVTLTLQSPPYSATFEKTADL